MVLLKKKIDDKTKVLMFDRMVAPILL